MEYVLVLTNILTLVWFQVYRSITLRKLRTEMMNADYLGQAVHVYDQSVLAVVDNETYKEINSAIQKQMVLKIYHNTEGEKK